MVPHEGPFGRVDRGDLDDATTGDGSAAPGMLGNKVDFINSTFILTRYEGYVMTR